MYIYVATPINARSEGTFLEKRLAAYNRVKAVGRMILSVEEFADARIVSPFDVNPIGTTNDEASALGTCVTTVLRADAVCLDEGWEKSRGCNLEYNTARIYGKTLLKVVGDHIEKI